jgi:hypothetical protein
MNSCDELNAANPSRTVAGMADDQSDRIGRVALRGARAPFVEFDPTRRKPAPMMVSRYDITARITKAGFCQNELILEFSMKSME